ncbi:hypothetical protein Tco_1530106 [Tanacetum coccineum]
MKSTTIQTITTSTTISTTSTKPTTTNPNEPPPQAEPKTPAKIASSSNTTSTQGKKIQRWTSEEEELLATCFAAVFEDPSVGRDQKMECFWGKVLTTYNSSAPVERTKDMLTSKWATLNANCQMFNNKHFLRLGKSGVNEIDVMWLAKKTFKDEFKGRTFTQESSWEIFRNCPNWDALDPVSTVHVEGETARGNVELFGEDPRPRPLGARAAKKDQIREHVGYLGE